MPLRTTYEVLDKGNTVPYPPNHEGVHRNFGFIDLRGRPDAVDDVPEAHESKALRHLLMLVAKADSKVITLGCDLGSHKEHRTGSQVAGGYIQLLYADYLSATPQSYQVLCKQIEEELKKRVGKDNWLVQFQLESVQLRLDGFDMLCPTPHAWFWARSSTKAMARKSRERHIDGITHALAFYSK